MTYLMSTKRRTIHTQNILEIADKLADSLYIPKARQKHKTQLRRHHNPGQTLINCGGVADIAYEVGIDGTVVGTLLISSSTQHWTIVPSQHISTWADALITYFEGVLNMEQTDATRTTAAMRNAFQQFMDEHKKNAKSSFDSLFGGTYS